jgi:phenylpropionate dioxygenase-like ring-hydroxylating dioxygenase large terminal subunit
MTQDTIFNPARYAGVRRPPLEAETLPGWCYTSRAFYDREVDTIFRKVWNFIGREDEIPNPGDYLTFDLCGEPIIILRDRANTVRAFANSCRHRGTRLLEGRGNCAAISCPYHAWTYALSGELIGAPGMEQTIGFDKRAYGLPEIRLESWAGFIFVNLDHNAGSLDDYLGEFKDRLASHDPANLRLVRRRDYDLACNWKIYIENAMEEYHTPTVHRASIGKQVTSPEQGKGEWKGMHMPAERTIAVLKDDIASAFPPIATLDAKAASGTYFLMVYPCTFIAATQDCLWWLQEFPQGPERTKVTIGSCFPKDTIARPDFAEKVEKYYRRWDKSLPEDNAISEVQQQGVHSSLYTPGRLSFHELIVHDIANWVLDRVL